MSLLVTGGAGFIGANFVRRRRATRPGERLVVLDALTYAGNLSSLAGIDGVTFVKGDICDAALVECHSSRSFSRRSSALRRREPCGPLDPRSGHIRTHQRRRNGHTAREGARRGRQTFRTRLDGRGLRRSRRRRSGVHRAYSHSSALALFGVESRLRSPGARLVRDLQVPHNNHALLEQLRAVSVSRKADSAHDTQRHERHAAARLRRRHERTRLDSRRGSLRRRRTRARSWSRRRGLQYRRTLGETKPRDRARNPRGARQARVAHPLRRRPTRSRSALCHRRSQDRARARLDAHTPFRRGFAHDDRVVSSERALVARAIKSGEYTSWYERNYGKRESTT